MIRSALFTSSPLHLLCSTHTATQTPTPTGKNALLPTWCVPLCVIVQTWENVPQLKVGHGHLSHPRGLHTAVGLAWISDLQSLPRLKHHIPWCRCILFHSVLTKGWLRGILVIHSSYAPENLHKTWNHTAPRGNSGLGSCQPLVTAFCHPNCMY